MKREKEADTEMVNCYYSLYYNYYYYYYYDDDDYYYDYCLL